MPRCGEVWGVRLDPTLGSEIAKTRPWLIISSSIINERRRTVVVVPLSTSPHAGPPLLVPVCCASRDVVAVIDQVRAVSKERLDRRIGELSGPDLESVERALQDVLELGSSPA
jgi:mRNA interferase MazF